MKKLMKKLKHWRFLKQKVAREVNWIESNLRPEFGDRVFAALFDGNVLTVKIERRAEDAVKDIRREYPIPIMAEKVAEELTRKHLTQVS